MNAMKAHIGVKLINAMAMTLGEYVEKGLPKPPTAYSDDAPGFLVEYTDGGKANTAEYSGYVSWSPADVFTKAYRPCDSMTFGLAIEALKLGRKVARAGWNGKDMWLSLSGNHSGVREIEANKFWSDNNALYAVEQENGKAKVLPCITMKTATGEILMGWLASQSDMLAEDWAIVP
jgi:hypothetical protein